MSSSINKESQEFQKITIVGKKIKAGTETKVKLNVGMLPSQTPIDIPVIVNKSKEEGPTLLLMGGLHGDEINGIEILRRIIDEKLHVPTKGTIVTIPILNIFGFIHFSREVPDGKDVNRSFPGLKTGSLASRMAYQLMNEIVPNIDYGLDFHTGGASRTNYPQIRCELHDPINQNLAMAFNAPFTIHSKTIPKSFRHSAYNKGKNIIVYEGGEALRFDEFAIKKGIDGYRRLLWKLEMGEKFELDDEEPTIVIKKTKWLRAKNAGLFNPYFYSGSEVKKGQVLGAINGPFGDYKKDVKSPYNGFIVGINNNPVVNPGDALIHLGISG